MSIQSYYNNLSSNLTQLKVDTLNNIKEFSYRYPYTFAFLLSEISFLFIKGAYKLYKSILSNNTILELVLDNIEITEHSINNNFLSNKLLVINYKYKFKGTIWLKTHLLIIKQKL